MELRPEYRQQISPAGFWIAILIVVVVLAAIGFTTGGRGGRIPAELEAASLVFVWLAFGIKIWRRRWSASPASDVLFVIGYTLFIVGSILRGSRSGADLLSTTGALLLFGAVVLMLFQPGGRKGSNPGRGSRAA